MCIVILLQSLSVSYEYGYRFLHRDYHFHIFDHTVFCLKNLYSYTAAGYTDDSARFVNMHIERLVRILNYSHFTIRML